MKKIHQIALSQTDKKSHILGYTKLTYYPTQKLDNRFNKNLKMYELHILSDEKPKMEDWCLDVKENVVVQCPRDFFNHSFKKIIASTDENLNLPKIPGDFIEAFVSLHNMKTEVNEALVEYEEDDSMCICMLKKEDHFLPDGRNMYRHPYIPILKIKIDSDNNVCISYKKMTYTIEEVVHVLKDVVKESNSWGSGSEFKLNDWIEEKLYYKIQ